MRAVDRRGEAVDVGVTVLLRFEQARPAGEDDVGLVQQLLLEIEQLGRGEAEFRQLVHRVIDGDVGFEVPREGQHHRRVIPGYEAAADRGGMRIEQAPERGLARVRRACPREMRDDDPDVGKMLGFADPEVSGFARADVHRLFPVNDVHAAREAAHEVLRTLEHEVPPQVRKADECVGLRIRRRRLGFVLHWHPDAS